MRLLILLLSLTLPAIANSGAWPRGKGDLFMVTTTTLSFAPGGTITHNAALYIEYGLTSRLTLGFDGYLAPRGATSNGVVFIRFPIGSITRPARIALTFGVGVDVTPNDTPTPTLKPVLKLGASWSRALPKGWLNIDSFATFDKISNTPALKADFTWGMKPNARTMLIWQLQTGKPAIGAPYANFAPSVVWSFGQRRNTQFEVGLVMGLTGVKTNSLKLGFWRSF